MADSRPFEAAFGGTECGQCEERIRAGQMVRYVGDVLRHDTCPEVLDVDAPSAVCPVHFIALPVTGVCGECS